MSVVSESLKTELAHIAKRDRLYIAGPMRSIKDFNFPAFDAAAIYFRARGFEVINPADLDRNDSVHALTDEDATQMARVYCRRDVLALLGCTHIAMLPGWEKSIGATAEYHVAKWIGLTVIDARTGDPPSNSDQPQSQNYMRITGGDNNRARLLSFHERICQAGRDLMRRKNHDYAGKSGDDPFANFRRVESMGICTTEQGFLVRLIDKLSRLSTFCEAGELLVKDEAVEDTLIDLINYCVLFGAYLEQSDKGAA